MTSKTQHAEYLWTAPTFDGAWHRAAILSDMTGQDVLIISGPAFFYVLTERHNWRDGLSPHATLRDTMHYETAAAHLEQHRERAAALALEQARAEAEAALDLLDADTSTADTLAAYAAANTATSNPKQE